MTIGSGQVSINDVLAEHGGSASNASLNKYYRGASTHFVHPNNTSIPASGPISLSHFRNTSRFGYYPIYSAQYNSANGAQYGWNRQNSQGSISYNYRYRGRSLLFTVWSAYDNTISVAIDVPNVPQSVVTSLYTPYVGTKAFTGYVANFFGFSVWTVSSTSNAFPVNTSMEIILL